MFHTPFILVLPFQSSLARSIQLLWKLGTSGWSLWCRAWIARWWSRWPDASLGTKISLGSLNGAFEQSVLTSQSTSSCPVYLYYSTNLNIHSHWAVLWEGDTNSLWLLNSLMGECHQLRISTRNFQKMMKVYGCRISRCR
jgi:hypothetical protein